MDRPSTGAPMQDDDVAAWIAVPGGTRQRAEEWALVLASQGIPSRIAPAGHGYALGVEAHALDAAHAAIATYRAENDAVAAEPPDAPAVSEPRGEPGVIGLVFGFLLLGLFAAIGGRDAAHPFFAAASANADQILDGEWWRAVTALGLHADLGHVLGNALFGVYFVTAVAADRGAGLGLALIVAAGFLGNLANALHHTSGHDSVGASTAVFGAIGALAGLALARRSRAGWRGRRLLPPIGAALGLLAMLGTSGARVDIWAHLYGLLCGLLLAALSAVAWPRAPGWPTQCAFGAATLLLTGVAARLALG